MALPAANPELKRMRRLATGLLLLMLVVFFVTSMWQARIPWLAYLRAFAEAATIGACADWFAVTALFRHPLGIPIPHTAIVPRNKQRIGEALGRFICNNFLAPEVIEARLAGFDAAGWAAHWLSEPAHTRLVAQRLSTTAPLLVDLLGHERVRQFARDTLRKGIDSIAVAPLTARALLVMMSHGQDQKLFDFGIGLGADLLQKNSESIRAKLAKRSAAWIPGWVDAKLADKLLSGLNEFLAETRDPTHPLRGEFRAILERLARQLTDDPALYGEYERLKTEVLDNTVVESYLRWLTAEVEAWVAADTGAGNSLLLGSVENALRAISKSLEQDASLRATLNHSIRAAVLNAVAPNRAEIGNFIASEVSRWDSQTLVARAENQLGKDLQFIRINGTVVGGLVGLIIFVVHKALWPG